MPRPLAPFLALYALLPAQTLERHFSYGIEQRVRNENWNNILDFRDSTDDERGQVRDRTRLWFDPSLTHTIGLHFGLPQETNPVFQPHTPTHFDKVFFETACARIRKLFIP